MSEVVVRIVGGIRRGGGRKRVLYSLGGRVGACSQRLQGRRGTTISIHEEGRLKGMKSGNRQVEVVRSGGNPAELESWSSAQGEKSPVSFSKTGCTTVVAIAW